MRANTNYRDHSSGRTRDVMAVKPRSCSLPNDGVNSEGRGVTSTGRLKRHGARIVHLQLRRLEFLFGAWIPSSICGDCSSPTHKTLERQPASKDAPRDRGTFEEGRESCDVVEAYEESQAKLSITSYESVSSVRGSVASRSAVIFFRSTLICEHG